jgi:transglutaminase-like putative cysteine protease
VLGGLLVLYASKFCYMFDLEHNSDRDKATSNSVGASGDVGNSTADNGVINNTALGDHAGILPVIRPIGIYALSGLVTVGDWLWSIDTVRGYLVAIDPATSNTKVLNCHTARDWQGAVGLAVGGDRIWFVKGQAVFFCDRKTFAPQQFVELSYPIDGIAVWESLIYLTCQKSGYIHVFEQSTGKLIAKFHQPGIGKSSLCVDQAALWVCDRAEQTVYCLDRATGVVKFTALTPFASPTGIAFYRLSAAAAAICYVVYADEEPYLRDDPNRQLPQLTFRDRTFIHPLYIQHNPQQHYSLSNGYRVELSYVEELLPLDDLTIDQVEWRIALPANSLRQRVRQIEPIGMPFTIESHEGQDVAVFRFDQIRPDQAGLFGWKATIEMYGLKYSLQPDDIEDLPLNESQLATAAMPQYLIDNDNLAMDSPIIQQAAQAAIGTETNILRKMLKIRNYVYDRLAYGIQPHIDQPDVALARGIASCGEYVGVLLALARLNGIACRTVGRYKCPPHPDRIGQPLSPDFNHVWLEFYVPGVGWLPMESNVDDVIDRGPYPERFFMGLAWYHTELGKGIKFETMTAANLPKNASIGDFALNHIRFRILEELSPQNASS